MGVCPKADKAIKVAHEAEKLADEFEVSDEARADLYHALGHFYVGRSHLVNEDLVIKDREQGETASQRSHHELARHHVVTTQIG